jgi:hypothetical protein
MDYKYAYLFGTVVIGLPMWLLLYYLRKDLRKELLFMTVFGLLITPPLVYWYTQDYWQPEIILGSWIGIEDLLFGTLTTGIAAILYLVLFRKRYRSKKLPKKVWVIPLFIMSNLIAYLLYGRVINSIYLTSAISALLAIIMMYVRKDLIPVSLISGLLCTLIWFICYLLFLPLFPNVFDKWWMLHNLSGMTLGSIPIEEFIWSMSWGMFAGPLYKFVSGSIVK